MCRNDETIDLNSAAGRPSPYYLVPGADPSFSPPAAVFISDLVPLRGKGCLKGASETTSAIMADLQGSWGCRDPYTVIRFIYKKRDRYKNRLKGGRCRFTHTHSGKAVIANQAPEAKVHRWGLKIVSPMRHISRPLIGCCSSRPLTFYPKRPQHLRQREISLWVLVSEGIPSTDLCCGINREARGRENTSTASDILGFSWYFAVIFIVLYPFITAVCTVILAG